MSLADRSLTIVTPIGRDSELVQSVLAANGIQSGVCPTVVEACRDARKGVAALLIAEEALSSDALIALNEFIEEEPEWSDLPVLILVAGGSETLETRQRAEDRANLQLNNVTLLERPIRVGSLVSSVKMALRSRDRQYEIRENMRMRANAEEAVRRSEKLAVAGRLAASIAHEINNPLESVTNLLYLIGKSDSLEEIRQFTLTAEQELARVSEITTQTLRFHRQQSKPIDVSPAEIIESVLALFQPRLIGANIRVRRDFRTHETVRVLAGEIRQVVANLVQNALDAMSSGGTLSLRIVPVELHPSLHVGGVRIVIADSGSGIPDRIRTTMFEPFVTTKGATGTGLGLWVSKEIVEKHGGEMRFRTSTAAGSHGTVFSIFLPSRGMIGTA